MNKGASKWSFNVLERKQSIVFLNNTVPLYKRKENLKNEKSIGYRIISETFSI